jgi:hypothetical protein
MFKKSILSSFGIITQQKTVIFSSTSFFRKNFSSKVPLIENFQTTWPHPRPSAKVIAELPKRTVPEKNLHFTMKATLDHGMSIFYPHLNMHPADLKVTMSVSKF